MAISSRHVCDADLNCLIPLSRIFTFFVKYSRMLIYISFTDIFSWWTPFSRSYELPTCRLCVNRMSGVTVNVQTTDQLSTRLSSKTFSPSSAGYSRGREAFGRNLEFNSRTCESNSRFRSIASLPQLYPAEDRIINEATPLESGDRLTVLTSTNSTGFPNLMPSVSCVT